MNTWYTNKENIPFSDSGDSSTLIQSLIDRMQDGDELIFTEGTYYFEHKVVATNRKNLTLKGYGVTIITHFQAYMPREIENAFEFIDSDNISFMGFTFTTDNPTNIMGRIVKINKETGYFDVFLSNNVMLNGNEWIEGLDTFNEDYSINFHIGWADPGKCHRWHKINRNTVRFPVWLSKIPDLDDIHIGELICMRFSTYPAGTFSLINCHKVLFEDITIESCAGQSCVASPGCSEFTFRRYNIRPAYNTVQGIACNTDGIVFKGLAKSLLMEDCHFSYMGDDSLNVHCVCGTVFAIKGNVIETGQLKLGHTLEEPPAESLSPYFAHKGDVIYIYDAKTMRKKAEITVDEYTVDRIVASKIEGEFEVGDTVVNSAYYPEVTIRNCSVSRSRARGFLIRTHNVLIENCYFEKTAGPAIKATCGIGIWNEMGPIHHMTIKNCVFEGCHTNKYPSRADGIVIGGGMGYSRNFSVQDVGVYADIHIINNRFYNLPSPALFAVAVDGLELRGNEIYNCCNKPLEDEHERYKHDLITYNCKNVVVSDNCSLTNECEYYNESI